MAVIINTFLIFLSVWTKRRRRENKDRIISAAKKSSHSSFTHSSEFEDTGYLKFDQTSHRNSYQVEGLNNFTLTSEYFEKDIVIDEQLRQFSGGQNDFTKVKVYKEIGVEEVSASELKRYIEENKDIKKVVIEKISINEASRMSLFFEPDYENSEEQSSSIEFKEIYEVEEISSLSLSELEDELNFAFLNNSLCRKTSSEGRKTLLTPNNRLQLSLRRDPIENQEQDYIDDNLKNASYERHTFNRKKVNHAGEYYYRVKDHMELFKVGSGYLRDYKAGIHSMGFSSYNLELEGQKTIFGMTSFFNYHSEMKICILTSKFLKSFYHQILGDVEKRVDEITDEAIEFELYPAPGFDFIEFNELAIIESKCRYHHIEEIIKFLQIKYDLILWDLPPLKTMNKNREIFFPIIRSIDSLTLIVAEKASKGKELKELMSFFQKYQVQIKGVLFSKAVKGHRNIFALKSKDEGNDDSA